MFQQNCLKRCKGVILIILGIHDGQNCSALFRDGKMLIAISRKNLRKNEYGYPGKSINKCLKFLNIKTSQIDLVVVSTKFL